jgi:hypothetical protein
MIRNRQPNPTDAFSYQQYWISEMARRRREPRKKCFSSYQEFNPNCPQTRRTYSAQGVIN